MRVPHNDFTSMISISIGLLLVFAVVGSMARYGTTAEAIEPIETTPVASGAQEFLVDVAWLDSRIADVDDAPVIIDVSDPGQYALEHIPGAVHVWWQDAMNLNGAGYGEAVGLGSSSRWVLDIPATQDQAIVVYDNEASKHASRLVWQLRTSGYDHAVVLDGGLAAWKGAGHEVSDIPVESASVPEPEDIWHGENEVTVDQLQEWLDDPNLIIVDSRSAAEQQDTVNDTVRLGQIPGSINIPAALILQPDGTFMHPEDIATILEQRGITPDSTIIVYGRFGTETGQLWLALRITGHDDVRILDDGWIAWGHDESRPIEPLDAP